MVLRQTSESLAGRIAYHPLDGFALDEVGIAARDRLWLRGGYPRSFLAGNDPGSEAWRRDLIRTYLERDLPDLGVTIPSSTLRRFWTMLAHWHAQAWSSAEFARSFGVADTTVRRYLDLLASTFMVRLLPPFHENIAKRQVKSPKVYFVDRTPRHALDAQRHGGPGARAHRRAARGNGDLSAGEEHPCRGDRARARGHPAPPVSILVREATRLPNTHPAPRT